MKEKLKEFFIKLFKRLKNAVYPRGLVCIRCGKELTEDERHFELCTDCLNEMPFVLEEVCPVCGTALIDNNCPDCTTNKGGYNFDALVTALRYEGFSRSMILDYKDKDKNWLYYNMLKFMTLPEEKVDFITYVPSSNKAIRKRGFDHARLLASKISQRENVEFIDALVRTSQTKDQTEMNKQERAKSIKGVFKASKTLSKDILKGKTVVLVDDVVTTGATASECASVLKELGATRVVVVCFARA